MRSYTSGRENFRCRMCASDRPSAIGGMPCTRSQRSMSSGLSACAREARQAPQVLLGPAVVLPEDHVARRLAVAIHRDDRGVLARADDGHDVVTAHTGGGQRPDGGGLHGLPDLHGVLLGDAPGLGQRVDRGPGGSRGASRGVDDGGLRPAGAQVDGQDVALPLHGCSLPGSPPAYEPTPCADTPSSVAPPTPVPAPRETRPSVLLGSGVPSRWAEEDPCSGYLPEAGGRWWSWGWPGRSPGPSRTST